MSDYDVFMSHNSKDKGIVRKLVAKLRERKLRVWMDEDELLPGQVWTEKLYEGIEKSSSVAVCFGDSGKGDWKIEETQYATKRAVEERIPLIPVLLPGAPNQEHILEYLPKQLSIRMWADLREGIADEGIDRLVAGILRQAPRKTTPVSGPEPQEAETLALTEATEVQELYVHWGRRNQGADLGELLRRARRLRRRYPHNPDIGNLTKLIGAEYRQELRKQVTGAAVPTWVAALVVVLVLGALGLLFVRT